VADDHPVFLEGFCTLVGMKYPEIDVVAAVRNGRDAVERERELDPDVVLLDIRMPLMNGIEAARLMKKRRPDAKIIMLTTFNEQHLIKGALQAGVKGYILKETPIEELVDNIRSVHNNNVLLSSQVAERLTWPDEPVQYQEEGADHPSLPPGLTPREREVFLLMLQGKNNRAIAEELSLGEGTVRNYVSRIYEIIGVHDRAAVVMWALEHGGAREG
jgi:DNA-binding NarL/FixJ family response regulator